MIAPTHFKDYRNPHLAQVWYEAERVLREAEKVIFVGYSLPDDDVEVVYLLKRSLAHLPPECITVVENRSGKSAARSIRDHAVGRRYRTLSSATASIGTQAVSIIGSASFIRP